ncbi:MAG TPA: (5-formylfuran-3-yl)methyl phosphate synthase [Nitrospinota bacterium]|nr:(5-formylfuran-3-yl)methyl phosphate synthase [Nitrospinota bacterium]|tara:strand:- start:4563 stop:5321 length:759 start_codon:yes stop_codon:yes gene_type:complete
MRLLTSVISPAEAAHIFDLSDLIDIKDPSSGSLGMPDPITVRDTRKLIGVDADLSVAIGDLDKQGQKTIDRAKTLVGFGATYIKTALSDIDKTTARLNLKKLKSSVPLSVKVIAAAYVDAITYGYFNPMDLPRIAFEARLDGVLLDTFLKEGKTLFDYADDHMLTQFVVEARELGLVTALAGSLSIEHLERIFKINPDWVGFRSALTMSGIREESGVDRMKVSALKSCMAKNNKARKQHRLDGHLFVSNDIP